MWSVRRTTMPGVFCAGDVGPDLPSNSDRRSATGIAALIAIRSYLQRHSDLRRIEINT